MSHEWGKLSLEYTQRFNKVKINLYHIYGRWNIWNSNSFVINILDNKEKKITPMPLLVNKDFILFLYGTV